MEVNEIIFTVAPVEEWNAFYRGVAEHIPSNTPRPRGSPFKISCYVNVDHPGNLTTRWLHTGILIYLLNTPIIWFSKRQNTVDSSSFGSEFIAL